MLQHVGVARQAARMRDHDQERDVGPLKHRRKAGWVGRSCEGQETPELPSRAYQHRAHTHKHLSYLPLRPVTSKCPHRRLYATTCTTHTTLIYTPTAASNLDP